MTTVRTDYLERMIEQFSRALAAIIHARMQQEFERTEMLIAEACAGSLGMEYSVLRMMDVQSVVSLLGDPHRVRLLAKLIREDSELATARGRTEDAARLSHRADALEDAALG